jgi:hypothetical protein
MSRELSFCQVEERIAALLPVAIPVVLSAGLDTKRWYIAAPMEALGRDRKAGVSVGGMRFLVEAVESGLLS